MEFYWKQNPKGNFGFFTTPLCYSNALDILESETLDKRRVELCKNFARPSYIQNTRTGSVKEENKKNLKRLEVKIGKLI